jgi:beta-lactamase class C
LSNKQQRLQKLIKASPKNPHIEAFIEDFESELIKSFGKLKLPGAAVAIVINGKIELVKAFGVKKINATDSVDNNTLFRIASVSKGFAAILMGMIKEQLHLRWADPIANHLPGFKASTKTEEATITIKNILSHTSGYPYQAYSTLIEDGISRDVMFQELQKITLSRNPGEIHSYQNVAYSLIEPILEDLVACDFQQLMSEMIFQPLNMNHASITYEDMSTNDNTADPHLKGRSNFVPVKLSPSYYNVAAAGGINASISDMAEWMLAVTGHRQEVVPKVVLDSVFNPVIPTRVRSSYFSTYGRPRSGYYGMGWRIVHYPTDTLIYHGGYANGFKSELALDREQDVAICILTNGPSNFPSQMAIEFFKILKFYEHDIKEWNKKMASINL